MIATLPMYDRPETAAANDRLWTLIREALADGPERLTRDGDPHWTDSELLLSQTCSLPYRSRLAAQVTLVARPVHDLPCPLGCYFSVIVTRADETRSGLAAFANARLAINEPGSQSGWAAVEGMAKDQDVTFRNVHATGSHLESARAVAEGRADLAALDAVSWHVIQRFEAFAGALSVMETSPPTPALPYITARTRDPAPIRRALEAAVAALPAEDRATLCLTGIAEAPEAAYLALPLPEPPCLSP